MSGISAPPTSGPAMPPACMTVMLSELAAGSSSLVEQAWAAAPTGSAG